MENNKKKMENITTDAICHFSKNSFFLFKLLYISNSFFKFAPSSKTINNPKHLCN